MDAIETLESCAVSDPALTTSTLTGLRCRSCRAVLFDDENIFTSHSNERKRTIKTKRNFAGHCCSHYFLDGDAIMANSLKWLEDQTQTGSPEGPINCWKCTQKLGYYNWKGAQCGCGTWQIPYIGIIKSKVDPMNRKAT